LAAVTVMLSLVVFSAGVQADEPTEGMTQGEFAMWLVEEAGLQGQLPPAALQSDAMTLLSNLGIQPEGGWNADAEITTGDLAYMLGISESEAAGQSLAELAEALVDAVVTAAAQAGATSVGGTSPTISPSGQ
jgi:hypothetical protein